MSQRTRMPYQDRESSTTRWVTLFVLLSLLAHALIFLAIILLAIFVPPPKLEAPPPDNPPVSLSLVPPPQPVQPRASIPTSFIPTNPDPGATPNQRTPLISDNNSRLKSQTPKPRAADQPLPDVTGKKNHSLDLQDTPLVQSKLQQAAAATPPTPKQQEQPQQPPPPPQPPQQQTQDKPSPPEPVKPTPKPPEPKPPKPPTPQVVKTPLASDGLPVLPPIDAPTLAPQRPINPIHQTKAQAASPPPSFELNKSDISGSSGATGPNSAAANATALGRYKAKVYRAVGARWYDKVGKQLQVLPVGMVHVEYTIHADGTVTTKVLEGGNGEMQLLLSISVNSIIESAPYDRFDDVPGLRAELEKTQAGNGDSFTDDFTFSVY